MKSAFFEFHVATTGLFTARANLQVTGHNIANAETPGYSRQYAMQRTNTPIALYNGRGMVGTGSEVYGVGQIRSFYLDKKYWSERGVLGEYSQKTIQLSAIEAVFNDLQTGGLSGVFNDFFDQLQSLSENPGDPTYRTNLIQSANSLIGLVQLQATALQKQQQDINTEIKAIVDKINSIGQQIVSLNRQIKTIEIDGTVACDLRDARARLVDELSIYVNVEVTEKEMNADYAAGKYPDDPTKSDKRFIVMINGHELVNHYNITTLECRAKTRSDTGLVPPVLYNPPSLDPRIVHNEMDVEGLYDIYASNGSWFNIYSPSLKGELKGLIDIRDGNNGITQIGYPGGDGSDPNEIRNFNTSYKGIPHYMDRLNELVRTFAMAVNEGAYYRGGASIPGVDGHIAGSERENPHYGGILFFTNNQMDLFTQDTSTTPPTYNPYDGRAVTNANGGLYILDPSTGNYVLAYDSANLNAFYSSLNIFNFALNPEIAKDPYKIAAAFPEPGEPSDQSDNRTILGLLKIKDDPSLFKEGKLSDYLNAISTELGIDINQAKKFESNYTDVTVSINNQRLSVSGVNVDEEVVNLVRYQQLYQAAAKLINIIDSIYNITVNRLGNW